MPVNSDPGQRPPLDKARITEQVGLIPDLSVEILEATPSTNAVAVQRAHEGAADGLVVVADHQTGGRGRLDRTWQTPPGTALTFSMLLRPDVPTRAWPWLPLLVGYAVDKALKAHGYDAGVKWPNDVLIAGRKVAGILVERVETAHGPAAVVGVGINTSLTADELPVPTATALALEEGDESAEDRSTLLVEVLSAIREAYDAWQVGGDLNNMRLADSYASACVTVGQQVRVEMPDGSTLEGHAVAIDPSGQLVVMTEHERVSVGAGDVVHVRPVADGAAG